MDLSRCFILLNGEPKTMQIGSIQRNGAKGYRVRFKNTPKSYSYGSDKVVWLSNPLLINPTHCQVVVGNKQQTDVKEIWKFACGAKCYWRIVHANGYVQDGDDTRIIVKMSCLGEEASSNMLAYLQNVAIINPLGKDRESEGFLAGMYAKLDFVGADTAAACYFNPQKYRPARLRHDELIYPFGCNASQKKAVAVAFEHQLSVIQGPPGTGKTQTILNIIANIVYQGKTVLVVSNNNSATTNVKEKLEKYGTSFIVAPLGSRENKEAFVANQPSVPVACSTWRVTASEALGKRQQLHTILQLLDNVYEWQNERARLLQELHAVALEWKHFCMDNSVTANKKQRCRINSMRIISLWIECQKLADRELSAITSWSKWWENIRWWWLKCMCWYGLHTLSQWDRHDFAPLIQELQASYYQKRLEEIRHRVDAIEKKLAQHDAKDQANTLTELSMSLFRASLYERYTKHARRSYSDITDIRKSGKDFAQQYPVVLSTTFSARSCLLTDELYDYVIVDEASQVSIDTGTLALTCAKNVVIVGDTLQLPNVVTDVDKVQLRAVMQQYKIPAGYDCAQNSFLQSVLRVIENVPETLLREHYRCHPRIINFCNQKFYGGKLLVMTEDKGETNVLTAIKTVRGNHAINHYNQREVDVVKKEVLPTLQDYDSIGIVTPYNNQVDAFNSQLDGIEAGTIHKYQGRENDVIIMSVVDNQITDFADDANMLNVAVSRAKKKFCLVMTGNDQVRHGNIMDLLDYIAYNNCMVTESKLASIFDYLYEQYTEQRIAFLERHSQISEYASENLTYAMLHEVITSDSLFSVLKVLCHVPLRQVVRETSLMSEDERRYAANYNTHLDFLIINRVSKQPVLAIETDGYSYHNDLTVQHQRDIMKNHILSSYGLALLRLSTKGSGEKEKVVLALRKLICCAQ